MNVTELLALADPSGLAKPDLDLKAILAKKIAPEFLHDIRGVSWRRRFFTFTTEVGVQTYDMPSTFGTALSARISGSDVPLEYIGESDEKIVAALNSPSSGKPYSYWFALAGDDSNALQQLWFNCPADVASYTVQVWYKWIVPPDLPDDFGFDSYIPSWLQYGLVAGLKRELYVERYGLGDPRGPYYDTEFTSWKQRAGTQREIGPIGDTYKSVF